MTLTFQDQVTSSVAWRLFIPPCHFLFAYSDSFSVRCTV